MFDMLLASVRSIFDDFVTTGKNITKTHPGTMPSTGAFPAPGKPLNPPKFDDAYTYSFYITLPPEKWLRSMEWLTAKLNKDYARGRFTAQQYESIQLHVRKMFDDGTFSGLTKTAANEAKKTAEAAAPKVTKAVTSAGSSVASAVTGAGGIIGNLGGNLGGVVGIALIALLVSKLLR